MSRSWIDVLGVNCMIWISVRLPFLIWRIWRLDEWMSLGLFSIECSMECIYVFYYFWHCMDTDLRVDIWFLVHIRQTLKDFIRFARQFVRTLMNLSPLIMHRIVIARQPQKGIEFRFIRLSRESMLQF